MEKYLVFSEKRGLIVNKRKNIVNLQKGNQINNNLLTNTFLHFTKHY